MSKNIRIRASALIVDGGSVLLVEYKNENDDGVHYNLPGGGLEPGETLVEAVKRETKEEACIDVEVGSVAFVYEYEPLRNDNIYGDVHSIGITFECKLLEGNEPRLPKTPDPNQIGIKWIPVSELGAIQLYPKIAKDIQNYCNGRPYRSYVEEHEIQLEKKENKSRRL
jgi:8-oxo-dGTP diphosphatase